jgi:hypothetical protein
MSGTGLQGWIRGALKTSFLVLAALAAAAARAPASEPPAAASAAARHWAFQPMERRAPPSKTSSRGESPIDAFVAARLEPLGLSINTPAERATLIRRLALDLTGLLPEIEEVDAFAADAAPDAYERLVDRVLASPRFGERWGQHWLDLARYADSNGYTIDSPRSIWPYRDWVIDSLNRDLPFDRFTIEQLAGDLLPGALIEQRIATGFHRNTLINEEGGTDPEQFRVEAIVDRVNTTGTVWLGLSIACAQCHDHKHDPISQKEYYQLYAFFNSDDEPALSMPTDAQRERQAQLAAAIDRQKEFLAAAGAGREAEALKQDGEYERLAAELAALERDRETAARTIASTLVLEARSKERPTHVQIRGDFLRKGESVSPGVPAALPPLAAGEPGSARPSRLDLARWLVDRRHPLVARVAVNRLWQQLFGTGLVETENDFGVQGSPPSHPELLDWLALEFIEGGWSLKRMLRVLVGSAAYRQSSTAPPGAGARDADPKNRLLHRQNRLRLDAEAIRDAALCASGLLTSRLGGPGVHPPQPEDVFRFTQVARIWEESQGEDRYRRGLYTFLWRSSPYPFLGAFDRPPAVVTCTRRLRSNTPLQALTLANDRAAIEWARGLTARILAHAAGGGEDPIAHAFRLCLSRSPEPKEREFLERFWESQRAAFAADREEAAALAPLGAADVAGGAAWTALARVLINLDEFITRE